MNGLIDWLLKTIINKKVPHPVKTNSRVIKAFAWGGAKQIFKTKKDLPEKALKSLYVVILE